MQNNEGQCLRCGTFLTSWVEKIALGKGFVCRTCFLEMDLSEAKGYGFRIK